MQDTNHPNLFILGAQKAGTTYLAQALAAHQDVFFTDPKETMFFSQKRTRDANSYQDYIRTYFRAATTETWRGEGSTTYLQWPNTISEIRRFVPGTPAFIVCLRQPLDKAISFYIHNWRRDRYPAGTSLSDVMDLPVTLSPLESSLYADAIERWRDAYSDARFLFLKFDLLQEDPVGFVRAATDFLEIDPMPSVPQSKINAGLPLVWEDNTLTIRPSAAGDKADSRPHFKMTELEKLQERFVEDLEKTERLTGLDLSSWKQMPEL